MASVIIPAHNEEAVLARCLKTLVEGSDQGELEIVVVCNGCNDRTADVARDFGSRVTVVETPTASKTFALNLGDKTASGFPRFYIDADVETDINAIRDVARILENEEVLAAAPRLEVDVSKSSWAVRAFYATWLEQPYHRDGMLGAGFYAVSEKGRARFAEFPEIIADDEFFRMNFRCNERATAKDSEFKIRAPKNLRDLIKIKSRSRLGLFELRQKHPDLIGMKDVVREQGVHLAEWLGNPTSWMRKGIYVGVGLSTRWRAKRNLNKLASYKWERDESSR